MSYSTKKFGRKRDVRRALMRSLMEALIVNERIVTTETRARAMRPRIEKVVTCARKKTLAHRRILLSRFSNNTKTVKKLCEHIAPRYIDRSGGYTRIIKIPPQHGSGRNQAVIEFV